MGLGCSSPRPRIDSPSLREGVPRTPLAYRGLAKATAGTRSSSRAINVLHTGTVPVKGTADAYTVMGMFERHRLSQTDSFVAPPPRSPSIVNSLESGTGGAKCTRSRVLRTKVLAIRCTVIGVSRAHRTRATRVCEIYLYRFCNSTTFTTTATHQTTAATRHAPRSPRHAARHGSVLARCAPR